MSLNPALHEAGYCPRCGAAAQVHFPRSLSCASCGYRQFFNPKPVAAVIPVLDDGRVLLLRRGIEPSRGKWTFPGGFVDLGESVEEAARRECHEELVIDVSLEGLVGVYSRPDDRIVLVVYRGTPLGEPRTTAEALEVGAFAVDEIPWDGLAFWSTTLALQDALGLDRAECGP
jgi:ADP-ribose pyrophosphatase YjhB (NUDIX family)